jgi:Galactose oxidase, central domain/Kelch motif
MFRRPSCYIALALGALLAACGEDTPTQPSTPMDPGSTVPLLATVANSWSSIAPMNDGMGYGPAVGVVPNSARPSIAYVFGGTNGSGGSGAPIRVYDVATNTWRFTKDAQNNRVYAFNTNGVGNIGDKLYFSGGTDYGTGSLEWSRSTWAFDPATETLTRKADMPFFTAHGVTGVIGDKLYVLPGTCSGNGWPNAGYCEQEAIRKLFRYNPATNIWVTKASAPHYHARGVGGVINNKFYVAGGHDQNFNATTYLDVYDPATNTWKTLAPLPSALQGLAGTVLQGQLFVVGATAGGSVRHYAYNPTSNKWNAKAPPSVGYGGPAAKVFLNGISRMLLLSGATDDNPDHSQMYTP